LKFLGAYVIKLQVARRHSSAGTSLRDLPGVSPRRAARSNISSEIIQVGYIIPHYFGASAIHVIVQDGAPWFSLRDVRSAIGVENGRNIADRLDDDDKAVAEISIAGSQRRVAVVNLPGLYALIALQPGQTGKRFKRWITTEVLPSIPNYGAVVVLPRPGSSLSSNSEMAAIIGLAPRSFSRRARHLKTADHGEWHPVIGLYSEKPVEQWWWNAAGREAVMREFRERGEGLSR
jgi:prophage antirepressor-like protein